MILMRAHLLTPTDSVPHRLLLATNGRLPRKHSLRTLVLVGGVRSSLLVLDRLVLLVALTHQHVDKLVGRGLVRKIGDLLSSADSSNLHDSETGRHAARSLVLLGGGDLAGQDVAAEVRLGTQRSSKTDH